jgi:hypothetical protein
MLGSAIFQGGGGVRLYINTFMRRFAFGISVVAVLIGFGA